MKEVIKVHILKTWPDLFESLTAPLEGRKTVELRFNDRDFQPGDILVLLEYGPETAHEKQYTGRHCVRVVTHVFSDTKFLKEGHAALSIREPKKKDMVDTYEISRTTFTQDGPVFMTGIHGG